MRQRAQQSLESRGATSINVFEAGHALSLEAERENRRTDETAEAGARLSPRVADITKHLTIRPSGRLKVIVVECSLKLSVFKSLAPFVPDGTGKVKQLRYRGYEVQLKVRP